jgi:Xaa-Pro aminopeptidase
MLTESGCRSRRARLFNAIAPTIDRVVLTSPEAIAWCSGFAASPFVFRSQGATAVLILSRSGDARLVVDNLQEPFAARALGVSVEMPVWYRCVEAASDRRALVVDAALAALRELGAGDIAVESAHCPLPLASEIGRPMHDLGPALALARRSKDRDEIDQISRCFEIATQALDTTRANVRPGWTELDLYRSVAEQANQAAGETVSVYGDFVCGVGCEAGGGPPTARVVRAGDLILLDFSVVLQGYRGDFASTFVCEGEPSREWSAMETACLTALDAAAATLRPGRPARDVHAAAVRVFAEQHLADHFPHHTGHGIGLGHPEAPFLVPQSEEVLAVGDVVTVEPGLYKPGIGGMRFEHAWEITPTGARQLTTHKTRL